MIFCADPWGKVTLKGRSILGLSLPILYSMNIVADSNHHIEFRNCRIVFEKNPVRIVRYTLFRLLHHLDGHCCIVHDNEPLRV